VIQYEHEVRWARKSNHALLNKSEELAGRLNEL